MDKDKYLKYTKTISQYFGASLIPMLLNLASNPLIALNMSPEDYAITGYYTSFNNLLAPLVSFYMLHYYTKRYYEVDADERDVLRATLAKSLIYFSGFVSVLCFVGLFAYVSLFNADSTIPFSPYAALTVFSLPITGLYTLMLVDMRMGRESGKFLRISLAFGVFLVLFNLLLVVVFKWGAFGKLLAPFVNNVVFFLYSLWYYKKQLKYSFDKKQFKEMIIFCFPLTIAAMLGFFSNGIDRVFLERLGNNNELGYYSVGVSMASYIGVFHTAIGNTFQPDLFQSIVQKNKKRLVQIITLLVGSTAVIVFAYIIAAPLVVKILTAGRYMMSVGYTRIIALSTLTSAMYYTVSQITIALGKSTVTLLTKIFTTLASVAMFSYLITEYEYIGAAWGIVLSFIISMLFNLLLLWLSNKTKLKLCR